jgi:aspartyl-tRNA(Asn)/glutamyl-tRNA(Gln) amidotransferase subunit A
MSGLLTLSLAQLSAEIRAGRVSPREATEACLARIAQRDPELNSFITVTADQARETARERAEELAAGRWRGPLHGVPLALKDLFLTAGVRTTSGSAALRDWIPDRDATVVRRLHNAGAVLLGKLNMHEHAFGATNENPHFGPVRHPRDPERLPGGSSGGSAAAVADGLCFGSLGSDTGGSIRCPAALCGVVGLKPTYGRVSRAGALPLSWSLDHMGPLTRTVTDAALLLEAVAGYDAADPHSAAEPVRAWASQVEGGVAGLRLGLPREHFWHPAHPGVREAVQAAAAALERAGAVVEEVSLPSLEFAQAAQSLILCAEAGAYHRPYLAAHYREYGADVRMRVLQGLCISAADYLDAQRARQLVRRELLDVLRTYDALLSPAVPIPAPRLGQGEIAVEGVSAPPLFFLLRNTFPFNLTGLPAISVPCGTAEDLPVGLQIAGRPWDETTVLQIARMVEKQTTS